MGTKLQYNKKQANNIWPFYKFTLSKVNFQL